MLYHGDCYEVLKHKIADDSVDLVVSDPPYELSGSLVGGGFMKKRKQNTPKRAKRAKKREF